jgi:hypothetical protein
VLRIDAGDIELGITYSAASACVGIGQEPGAGDREGDGGSYDWELDAALLHRRDVVRLIPGEVVPADGVLLPGARIGVDEAMMTVRTLRWLHRAACCVMLCCCISLSSCLFDHMVVFLVF